MADTFFKNIGLLTEIASFLYLKHKRPNMRREYEVPGSCLCGSLATTPVIVDMVHMFWWWSTERVCVDIGRRGGRQGCCCCEPTQVLG